MVYLFHSTQNNQRVFLYVVYVVGGLVFRSRLQWLWNLRLDLGQHLSPSPVRLTEFAPAAEPPAIPPSEPVEEPLSVAPSQPPQESPLVLPSEPVQYGPPQ